MDFKTKAIALTYIKHGETSIISKILTKKKGIQSFIIKNIRSKKSKKKLNCFEPLQQLEITSNYKKNKALQYIKEVSVINFQNVAFLDINKKLTCLFIAELISKNIQENQLDDELFNYVWRQRELIVSCSKTSQNFIVKFLYNLSVYLGIQPNLDNINRPFFDIEQGCFVNIKNLNTLEEDESLILKNFILKQDSFICPKEKKSLINTLFLYYESHGYKMKSLNSPIIIDLLKK